MPTIRRLGLALGLATGLALLPMAATAGADPGPALPYEGHCDDVCHIDKNPDWVKDNENWILSLLP